VTTVEVIIGLVVLGFVIPLLYALWPRKPKPLTSKMRCVQCHRQRTDTWVDGRLVNRVYYNGHDFGYCQRYGHRWE
jgi:hypothetical protein